VSFGWQLVDSVWQVPIVEEEEEQEISEGN
jgi:hypothetical protein